MRPARETLFVCEATARTDPVPTGDIELTRGNSGTALSRSERAWDSRQHEPQAAVESLLNFGVVADVDAFDEKDDVFRDVRGVIGNPFEVAGDKNQIETLTDDGRIVFHE